MEKFVVIGQHHQHPTRNLKLNLPKAKHYAHVAVKDGEKVLDTKCVIEHAVYKSSMSLQHQVRHTVPYLNKPGEKIEYLPRSLQSILIKQPFPLNQGPVNLPFECEGRMWEDGGVKVNARSAEEVLKQRVVFHHGADQLCGDWHPVVTGIPAWKNTSHILQRSYEVKDQTIRIQGPSSLKDMSIVYPCNQLCCSVRCPCFVCLDKRDNCKIECNMDICQNCNSQCSEHQIKLPRDFNPDHDHCMLVTQKVDQVQFGVPFTGIPLSCVTCTNDVQEHQALHIVFHSRCRFCRHQMRVLYEALSKEIVNSADYKKAIELVRWSDARTCSVCLSEHQDSYARKKHEKQIHAKEDREFKCEHEHCDKSFTNKSALDYHVNKHRLEPSKETCDICGAQFFAKTHLNEHKAIVHGKNGESQINIECSYCDKTFHMKKHLNRHVREKHMETNKNSHFTEDVSSIADIKCDSCEKTFKRRENLERHVKSVHSEKKLFSCDLCTKIFSRKDILLRHVKCVHKTVQ